MNIFITGATGYIGGSIAARLLERGHSITGLVRSKEKADRLLSVGIEPVLGNLDDAALLQAAASGADAVINTASSDHRPAVEAMLAGLEGSSKPFLHTSGAGKMSDNVAGEVLSHSMYAEDTAFDPLPERQARHDLDQLVQNAASRGIRSVVICPTLIYGQGLGLSPDSVQLPLLAAKARENGVVRTVGPGRNAWSNVHILDLLDLYELALERAPAGANYFAENGAASFADMARAIADRYGLAGPEPMPLEEAVSVWGRHAANSLGSNSIVTSERARRELGWAPTHGSVIEWIGREM